MAILQEHRLGYHSRAGLEPGTWPKILARFSTLRLNHYAARGITAAAAAAAAAAKAAAEAAVVAAAAGGSDSGCSSGCSGSGPGCGGCSVPVLRDLCTETERRQWQQLQQPPRPRPRQRWRTRRRRWQQLHQRRPTGAAAGAACITFKFRRCGQPECQPR
jgi:hypothetical protein